MWCDNCLLLFPLRVGGIAWACLIALYSLAGGIFMFLYGPFLFFTSPEWQVFGGIGMIVGLIAVTDILAFSNRSYVWTRAALFVWPFAIVASAIRAVIMIVELQRGQSKIAWECNNGGQLWPAQVPGAYTTVTAIPTAFCTLPFSSLYYIFVFSLLIDIGFQLYMFFLTWRFSKRIEHYADMKGPFAGGYYA